MGEITKITDEFHNSIDKLEKLYVKNIDLTKK